MDPITLTLLVLAAAAAAAVTFMMVRRRIEASRTVPPGWDSPPNPSESLAGEQPVDFQGPDSTTRARSPAPFVKSDQAPDFEWESPVSVEAVASATPPAGALPTRGADLILRRKIRDRYIAARFPCTAQSSADLENIPRVIKASRLFFEEDQPDRALELLELASEQSPGAESLDLAQLEIAFLTRDAETYGALAIAFRHNRPASKSWDEIARLGRIVAPRTPIFGAPVGEQADAHYGAWPEMPNWIQASWDLTGEILGSEFHRAMERRSQAFEAGPMHKAA